VNKIYTLLLISIILFSCQKIEIVHDYNYKTIIDKSDNNWEKNHFNLVSIDNICEIEYGFLKYPNKIKVKATDGTLIVRRGIPLTYFIDIDKISKDIEYIKFDTIELITKSKRYDLTYLSNSISYEIYMNFFGDRKETGYSPFNLFWESDNEQIIKQLKDKHTISIREMRIKGNEKTEEIIKKSTYEYNEEEKKLLREERKFRFIFKIKYLLINIEGDEEIRIICKIQFTKANGNIEYEILDNIYFREHSINTYIRSIPIKFYPEENEVEL